MSRQLGFFDDDVRDFPELNKCPDCETFFADSNCPLCGKECPPEMRAGNRKPVKAPKKRSSGSNRVQFVPWYYSTWFIILMLIFMPIVGLILLWTGYWKKHWKVIATVVLVGGYLFTSVLLPLLAQFFLWRTEIPVNTSVSETEYRALCMEADAEQLYRNAGSMIEEYVTLTVTVDAIIESQNDWEYSTYYQCHAYDGGKQWRFLLRDWRPQESRVNLTVGDMVTVWGEVGGNMVIYDYNGTEYSAPGVHILYLHIEH